MRMTRMTRMEKIWNLKNLLSALLTLPEYVANSSGFQELLSMILT